MAFGATRGAIFMSCSPANGRRARAASSNTTANNKGWEARTGQTAGCGCVSAGFQNRPIGREGDRRSGAAAERALQFDRAAVQFHDALDGGQTETRALMTPAQ